MGRLYGESFGEHLKEPCSAFVAEGSPVVVRWAAGLRQTSNGTHVGAQGDKHEES